LTRDYSPRTARIVPVSARAGKPVPGQERLASGCAIDAKALGVAECLARPEMLFDQRRIPEEAVGHQTQLAAGLQMACCFAQELFAGLVVGVHAAVEGRVADDRA